MTTSTEHILGIIPARWESTRFPGKPLALIDGVPLLQRVVNQVRKATQLSGVVVATDDNRIMDFCHAIGVEALPTRKDHPSGTDRVAEVAEHQNVHAVINIQGDEPLIDPALIDQLAEVIKEETWDMASASAPIKDLENLTDPSVVKVVTGKDQRALYFSRSLIPHSRDGEPEKGLTQEWYQRHIGIYAYKKTFLMQLVKHPPTMLEELEKLEQLRALHLGARIHIVSTDKPTPGVDTPEDVKRVERLLRTDPNSTP